MLMSYLFSYCCLMGFIYLFIYLGIARAHPLVTEGIYSACDVCFSVMIKMLQCDNFNPPVY